MRILVIRSHRLGDLVQITPLLRALRRRNPGAAIHLLVEENFAYVLADFPGIAKIHQLPKARILAKYGNWPESLSRQVDALAPLIRSLRARNFDWVINRQAAPLESIIAGLSAPRRISGPHYDPALDQIIEDPATRAFAETIRGNRRAGKMNVVDHSFHVVDLPIESERLYLPVDKASLQRASEMLTRGGWDPGRILIGIQAGASKGLRHCDPEQMLRIAEALLCDRRIYLATLGTGEERQVGDALAAGLSDPGRLIRLEGKTSWPLLKALLARCDLLITPDTGPMHVAAAVGTRVVALFWGTAHATETGPYGPGHFILQPAIPCAPCLFSQRCSHTICRRTIRPEHVARAVCLALAAAGKQPTIPTLPLEAEMSCPGSVRLQTTGEEPWRGPFALKSVWEATPTEPISGDASGPQETESRIQASDPAAIQ